MSSENVSQPLYEQVSWHDEADVAKRLYALHKAMPFEETVPPGGLELADWCKNQNLMVPYQGLLAWCKQKRFPTEAEHMEIFAAGMARTRMEMGGEFKLPQDVIAWCVEWEERIIELQNEYARTLISAQLGTFTRTFTRGVSRVNRRLVAAGKELVKLRKKAQRLPQESTSAVA
jgi:hypothetical protein